MARLIIENLTIEQAETLAYWYEGQGEQNASEWFDTQDVKTPYVDCSRKGGFIIKDGDTVTIFCKETPT
jgi:hypothetical protein